MAIKNVEITNRVLKREGSSGSVSNVPSSLSYDLRELANKVDNSFFGKLFSAIDSDGNVIPVNGSATPVRIRANFDFFSVGESSAFGIDDSGGGGGDGASLAAVWTSLGSSTGTYGSSQINASHLTNALASYATQSWVEAKGYLTSYTETDPVFTASAAHGITSADITSWNSKPSRLHSSMDAGECVRIQFNSGRYTAMVFVRGGKIGIQLVLVGTGYGASTGGNQWTQLSNGVSEIVWSIPKTGSITKSIEISNTSDAAASIDVITFDGDDCTITKIDALTTTGINNPMIDADSIQTISGVKTFSAQIKSTVATGTSPLVVASTTLVSNLNADLLDGVHASGLFTELENSGNNISLTIGGTTKTLQVGYADNANSASTATTLKNSRTIWGQNFDGSANVSGDMTGVGNLTASGNINVSNGNGAIRLISSSGRGVYDVTSSKWLIGTNGTDTYLMEGNVGINTTTPVHKLHVKGDAYVTNLYLNGKNRFTGSDTQLVGYIGDVATLTIEDGAVRRSNSNANITLGTSTYRWANVYSVLGNFSGLITASGNIKTASYIEIGDYRIVADTANTALKVVNKDGTTAVNFYATGENSALGVNTSGTQLGNSDASRKINYVHIQDALTNNGYATQSWVNQQGFIKSYAETDPVFTASAAHGITSANITSWNNKVSNVQADWNATSGLAVILNKPTNLVTTTSLNTALSDYLPLAGGTLTGRLITRDVGSTWAYGFSPNYSAITFPAIDDAHYHPYLHGTSFDGSVWNLGGIQTRVGIFGYVADHEGNYTDWSTWWNTTNGYLTHSGGMEVGGQITSSVANGTAPLVIASSTLVSNLNADLLDGIHASGLFTSLTNSGNNISITIGDTNKTLQVGYATSAGKSTTLATARTLWGQSFDGSANVSGNMTGVGSIAASDDITVTKSDTSSARMKVTNGNGNLSLLASTNRGLYDDDSSKWLIATNGTNTFMLHISCTLMGTPTPLIYTLTEKIVSEGVASNLSDI